MKNEKFNKVSEEILKSCISIKADDIKVTPKNLYIKASFFTDSEICALLFIIKSKGLTFCIKPELDNYNVFKNILIQIYE